MSFAGPAIPVGSPTSTRFNLERPLTAVNVQIRFFSDAAGLVPIAPGAGTATLTATHEATMMRGTPISPELINSGAQVLSAFSSGSIVGAAAATWQELALGGGTATVTITPSALVPPPGAVTYSIVIDTEGRSP